MAQTKTAKKPAAKKATTAKKATPKKKASPKKKAATAKSPAKPATAKRKRAAAGKEEVTVDRRRAAERRDEAPAEETAIKAEPTAKLERREKVNRRRQIDPTTCERDYSDAEVEFMNALDAYKRTSGRMFPTCSEVLEVVRGMGYVQLTPAEQAVIRESRGEVLEEASVEDSAEAEANAALADSDELRVD